MTLFYLVTGRAPSAPRGPGGTWMTTSVLLRWIGLYQLLFAVALAFSPVICLAASNSSPNLKFGIDDADSRDIVDSVYSIWRIVANVGVYGGAIVAIVGFLVGIGQRVIWIAIIVALIGGFGEWALGYLLQIGGMDVIERQTT